MRVEESEAAPRRFPNEAFFVDPRPPRRDALGRASIPEGEFYGAPRPAAEPGFVARAAAHPLRFGVILFALGWTGILMQLGFLRQLVIGAPVFEEFAKFGPALVLVTILGARRHAGRLPWAWLSGASFGVFEHFSTYGEEPLLMFAERVAFHAGATGLSMALYTIIATAPDVRARWVTTMPATVLHWINNFGALVFAFMAALFAPAEYGGLALAILVTVSTFTLTFILIVEEDASRERFSSLARVLLPRIFDKQALAPYAEENGVTVPAAAPLPTVEPAPAPTSSEPGRPSTSDATEDAALPGRDPAEGGPRGP